LAIRITTEAGQTATTIQIEGHLTGADLPGMRTECESASPPLRLDLSGLRAADSDGIRALRSLSEAGAELHGASPYIRQLLLEADTRDHPGRIPERSER
jgi:anti-anti-sigma regulatory factor